jgi:mRNA-degrading endonuclease RelE of RelBE toxin-antitoxin system
MPYQIRLTEGAIEDIESIRVFDRRKIVEAVHTQLVQEPDHETRNRKRLRSEFGTTAPKEVWELRVGNFRVFYRLDEAERTVTIEAVREKKQGQTTEDIYS